MKLLRFAAGALVLAIVALFLLPLTGAFAQTVVEKTVDTTIEIPIGQWISAAGELVLLAIPVAFAWLCRLLPTQLANALVAFRAEQLLGKAVTYGINATAGAVKDRPLSIDVGSEVIQNALQFAIDNAPSLVKTLGGTDLIRQKIIARLSLDENVAVDPRNPGYLT